MRGIRRSCARYRRTHFVLAVDGFAVRRTIAFGRDVYAAARGERLVIGSSDEFRFDVFFASGRSRRNYGFQQQERRVSRDEVVAANRAWLASQNERFRDAIATRIGEFPHNPTAPAFGGLLAGADGTIWAQEFVEGVDGGRRWTVFAPDGRALRVVRTQSPMRIVDAGADYVLAWQRDAMGVERILLFDLPPVTSPAAPGR